MSTLLTDAEQMYLDLQDVHDDASLLVEQMGAPLSLLDPDPVVGLPANIPSQEMTAMPTDPDIMSPFTDALDLMTIQRRRTPSLYQQPALAIQPSVLVPTRDQLRQEASQAPIEPPSTTTGPQSVEEDSEALQMRLMHEQVQREYEELQQEYDEPLDETMDDTETSPLVPQPLSTTLPEPTPEPAPLTGKAKRDLKRREFFRKRNERERQKELEDQNRFSTIRQILNAPQEKLDVMAAVMGGPSRTTDKSYRKPNSKPYRKKN